ncbi:MULTISPECIES: MarR family transcriptional regulator [unclassified Bacillus (in: firmicutes)]|uniref:MarR family transcriptional regulator n=1 Tax=unclassified Bacillus (in: firmicutes) TaxID=185979 RepID=UPI0030FC6216
MSKNIINFEDAEKKAKKRDLEIEYKNFEKEYNNVSKIELESAMETVVKATGKELYIGTKKSPQSKVRFAQFMQENLGWLYKNKYLTDREKIFLSEIVPYIAFSSNCIVLDIKAKTSVPANISEIAKLIDAARQSTSTVINSLVRKGILFKGISGIEGNNAKAYAVFVNPHVIYAGDKDCVNETLQVMFYKAMKMKILKDLPNKLF